MRPDGANQIHAGVLLLIFAVLMFGLSFVVPEHVGPIFVVLSVALGGFGLPLLFVGWIIQAIWYLPGKGDAVRTTDQPTLVLDEQQETRKRA